MACFGRDVNAPDHNLAARALAEARQAADLAPHDEIANRALRMVYATNGHYREALEQAFTSLELTRANERTFGQIAYLWNVLGRPDKAIAWYARAKATGQQLADYEALIGDSWLSLGDEAAAEEHYRASMKLRSDLPDGTVGLSRMLMLRGDLAGARELCERTTRDYPNSPHPRMLLAQIEFFSRNFARAEQLYRELHEASPRGGTKGEFYGAIDYASALARLRLERGDGTAADSLIAQANDDAERQLAEAPRSAPILYRHAALAALTGDRDAALARLTAAVENGWSDFQSMSRDPRFDTVAADPRFQELVSSVEQRLKQLRTSMAR
jgi:tetratricopeptide (TPR) repeat protein